ncbi:MAG TPA: VWA domain-containing protein [Pyrinomonadaceae bacterium]
MSVCLGVGGRAQPRNPAPTPTPQDDDIVERVESNLVLLNVGVADQRGRAITDLSRADFVVYEDGVRQNITSFEPTTAPFSLVLLLDMSGSTLNFRPTLKQSAIRFLDALAPDDRVAVVAFWRETKKKGDNRLEVLADFTNDRKEISFAITRAEGSGQTNLYEGLRFALRQLAREGQRRKAVVVLTDGKDTELEDVDRKAAAAARTGEDALAAVKPEASTQLRAVLDAADRQGVTVYPLALPSGDIKRIADPTPQQVAIFAGARARLQSLADNTGGRLHAINRLEDLGRLYAEVAAELRTLYSIAYQSSSTRRRDGSWRAVNIEVTRAQLIARSRPGYYAR